MDNIRNNFFYKCDNLFNAIHPADLKTFQSKSKIIKIKKNKIVVREKSLPDGIYYIKKGKVKIYQLNSLGKFQILYVYTEGEYFGFRPILSHTAHPVSAESIEDCELLFYPKDDFLRLLANSPAFNQNLLYSLSYEFTIWVNLMSALSHKAVKERVALALLILNEKFKKSNQIESIGIQLGREDIGSFSNTTTETCVRILTQFKKDKLIQIDGRRIKLLDIEQLLALANLN